MTLNGFNLIYKWGNEAWKDHPKTPKNLIPGLQTFTLFVFQAFLEEKVIDIGYF